MKKEPRDENDEFQNLTISCLQSGRNEQTPFLSDAETTPGLLLPGRMFLAIQECFGPNERCCVSPDRTVFVLVSENSRGQDKPLAKLTETGVGRVSVGRRESTGVSRSPPYTPSHPKTAASRTLL